MDFAIIIEKNLDDSIRTLRSTVQPPPPELVQGAKSLDAYLRRRIPGIESNLVRARLLDDAVPNAGCKKPLGNVLLWHALGRELRRICREKHVAGRRERRWLWDAIENLYATERIKRARRGRTRLHFEYCYRLAQFPRQIAERLNWSEWVYFFDSPTVREEPRADKWLMRAAKRRRNIDRRFFRRFTENLNKRIRRMDSSVLTDTELFQIYDEIWKATNTQLRAARTRRKPG